LTARATTAEPATRLIVIGASAGGLPPLLTVVGALPADLPAAVLVVVHVSPSGTSRLPQILARAGAMDVEAARDGLPLRAGLIAVAPPDCHLVVADDHVVLDRGPRENGHRPAVDPLFRSAAAAYGDRCCGVVLSGVRDDGAAGMAEVKRLGGIALVQAPAEALYPDMPASAMAATNVDDALPAAEIGAELVRLATRPDPGPLRSAGQGGSGGPDDSGSSAGTILSLTCPECGGVLTERSAGGALRFTCHVGHAFSAQNMVAAHSEAVERAMWTAARSLEDRATLLRRMADRARVNGGERSARQFERNAEEALEHAEAIRAAIAALDDAAPALPDSDEGRATA
jgi:two-component system, chemotaxis family, protein-glutamate methylesterase/glutaminase